MQPSTHTNKAENSEAGLYRQWADSKKMSIT